MTQQLQTHRFSTVLLLSLLFLIWSCGKGQEEPSTEKSAPSAESAAPATVPASVETTVATAPAALVTSALGMAIDARRPTDSTVIHSDQGTPFCSWAFTRRAQESGLVPSMGAVGSCFDNALMEAFFHLEQLLDLAFDQPADRNVRPPAHHLGDVFLVDFFLQHLL